MSDSIVTNFLLLIIAMLLFFIIINQQPDIKINVFKDSKYRTIREKFYNCITKSVDKKTLNYSNKLTSECEMKSIPKGIVVKDFRNRDETKRHIMPKDDKNFEMTVITLGIGKDIHAEELLRNATKQKVRFYGCDPITDVNSALYSKIGDYFPFAIAADGGYSGASVFVNDTYVKQSVVHVGFMYFLEKIIKQKFIDVLWMDAEGAEYGIMPYFYRNGLFDQHDIVICQLNVEVHNIRNKENNKKAWDFYHNLLQDRRYLAMKPTTPGHHRWYFVNFDHPTCIDRYLQYTE